MLFKPGKLTTVFDGGAGSSSKGLRAAYVWEKQRESHTTFAENTFMSNAAHTVITPDGVEHVFQCLSSITPFDNYEKQYISPGAVFALHEIMPEIEKYNVNEKRLGIHPNTAIVTQKDIDYEKGTVDFEGNVKSEVESANLRLGSTLHGVGAARARRILRRGDSLLARDVPELRPFLCKTNEEIADRLERGESGLKEIAQGFQLSLFSDFWPKTTSRNCTVAAAFDDAMLPIKFAGPIIANFRTFPIRVNNNKFLRKSDGKICTKAEYDALPEDDKRLVVGDSGDIYNDQKELNWEEVRQLSGYERSIAEITTLTKLERRVFSFSRKNLAESIRFNDTGDDIYISVNFLNYIDHRAESGEITNKVKAWLLENIKQQLLANTRVAGVYLGYWKTLNDSIFLSREQFLEII